MSTTLVDRKRLSRTRLSHPVLVVPLIAYLVAFYAYPVAAMMLRSITDPSWTLENFRRAFENPVYLHVLWLTFRVGVIVTVVALILGFPVAYVLARIDRAKSNLLMMLVLLPFWTSILVRTYAWMVLLGRQGIINQFLLWFRSREVLVDDLLSWLGLPNEPLQLLNTSFAVYVAMVHILLPFMILPLYSVIRSIDGSLLRAAEGLGATPIGVFRQVLLPLALPGVSAGCLLVFILALGFFITPALVGGPRDLMIAVLIEQQVELFNWPFASALAVMLLAAALLVFAVFARTLGVTEALGRVQQR
jgi:ABC-type spermidine/putrescine transport system permease subunit I